MTVLSSSRVAVEGAAEHVRRASASGASPYRAMLVGDAAIVAQPDLAEAFAAALADRTGHGVDVEAVAAAPLADAAAGALLRDRDLSRVDALVVVLDGADADAVHELVHDLTGRLTVGCPLVVVVPPPSALAAGQHVDDLVRAVRAEADALTPVVRLAEDPAGDDDRSTRWASEIADATGAAMIAPMVWFAPDDQYDEDLRLDAVDLLQPRDGLWVATFQRIVDDAKAAYGVASAALSIVDADYTRYGVTAGFEQRAIRRGQTVCNRVLRTYGGLIVGDAQQDLRFQRNPDVKSGEVRFYAGYRIESEDGAPLGSLCVFDSTPREVTEDDLVALRDLAVAAQRQLWSFQRAAS